MNIILLFQIAKKRAAENALSQIKGLDSSFQSFFTDNFNLPKITKKPKRRKKNKKSKVIKIAQVFYIYIKRVSKLGKTLQYTKNKKQNPFIKVMKEIERRRTLK